jgi:hypothetical protein
MLQEQTPPSKRLSLSNKRPPPPYSNYRKSNEHSERFLDHLCYPFLVNFTDFVVFLLPV